MKPNSTSSMNSMILYIHDAHSLSTFLPVSLSLFIISFAQKRRFRIIHARVLHIHNSSGSIFWSTRRRKKEKTNNTTHAEKEAKGKK